jgi:predicted RNase H-like nuclease (RuvC/YqgF family)
LDGNLVQHIIILIGTIVAAIGWYITRQNLKDEREKTEEQKRLDAINPPSSQAAEYERTIARLNQQIEELRKERFP